MPTVIIYSKLKLPVFLPVFPLIISIITASLPTAVLAETHPLRLEGVWFTCEFARSQSAPDDNCVMFDDEGFEVIDGELSYLRNEWSEETKCRGNKKGQCFLSSEPEISVSVKPVGKIGIDDNAIFVSYLACTQKFSIAQKDGFVEVIPDANRCFWAKKRHFYVSRYTGKLNRQ